MSIQIFQPHDSYTRYILSDIEVSKSIMKSHLPPNLVKRIDWGTLQLANKSFVTEELQQLHSDVVWRCILDDGETYLYWICENQSTPDEDLPLRTLEYTVLIMRQHIKEGHKKLPLVISICIYAGVQSPYSHPVDIYEIFGDVDLGREYMFRPMELVDLTIVSKEELLKDETAGLIKVLLQQGVMRDHLDWINNNQPLIDKLISSKFGIVSVFYILGTDDKNDPNDLIQAIIKASPQYKDRIMTAVYKLQEEARKEAIQEDRLFIAKNMINDKEPIEKITRWTGLSKEAIEKLKKG